MTLPDPSDWPTEYDRSWPAPDLLHDRTAATPDRTAVVDADADRTWSYDEYDRRVSAVAAGLAETASAGRVGLLLDTGVDFATAFFAARRLGRPVVPLNLQLAPDALADQVDRADVTTLVCGPETADIAVEIAPTDTAVVAVDESARDGIDGIVTDDGDAEPARAAADDDALVMFTSGTTGRPKGVRLTPRNLVASAVGSAHRLGVEAADRWLVVLPTYHMGGLAPLVRATLYGTAVVLQREFDPDETARVLDERSVSGVSLVPTMLSRLLDAGWDPGPDLRFVLLGGGPVPNDLVERCQARDVPVYPTYGTTETASQVATATPAEAFAHPDTAGRPLAGTDVTVRGDGEPCDPGETGEIVVDGPTVSPGYLSPDRTAAAFDERGFHTGDLGHFDAAGRLYVAGRIDDRIVTGGENVDPTTVADVIRTHPGVEAVAVVGLEDPEWGERVAALVVADDLSPEAVVEHCRGRLAGFECPKTVGVAGALPRTPSGTVDREAVREWLRAAGREV